MARHGALLHLSRRARACRSPSSLNPFFSFSAVGGGADASSSSHGCPPLLSSSSHALGFAGLEGGGGFWRRLASDGGREAPPKLFVVQPRHHPAALLRAKLEEALRLAEALGAPRWSTRGAPAAIPAGSPWVVVQQPQRGASAASFFGKGTIANVKAHLAAASSQGKDVDAVYVNASLSGVQQRNLQNAWGMPVFDRFGLIIEIFGAHAQTRAAKLQVDLAALEYRKSRLVRETGGGGKRSGFGTRGELQVVSARARAAGGGQGFLTGAGESELQLQRRRIIDRRKWLQEQLAEVQRTRALHRTARQRRSGTRGGTGLGLPVIAVVGYTNAGKSSLVGVLSKQQGLYVDDRLFATLDPRARSVVLPSGRKVLFSDTVGFISDLPIQLLEAFRATLEEVVEADLLLHVVDGSAANAEQQRETVLRVLMELGIPLDQLARCSVEAWNKADLCQSPSAELPGKEEPLTSWNAPPSWKSFGSKDREGDEDEDNYEEEVGRKDEGSEVAKDSEAQAVDSLACLVQGSEKQNERIDVEETEEEDVLKGEWRVQEADRKEEHSWGYKRKGLELHGKVDLGNIPRVVTSAVDGSGLDDLLRTVDALLSERGR